MNKKMISVVVPVYNEEALIETSYQRLVSVLEGMEEEYELIFIDDGSKDKSLEMLIELSKFNKNVKNISFSRNFGHQMAITAGMDKAKGDAIVVIDADLQDPPEVITEMVSKWKEGYDVVYGKRIRRDGETLFKKITAKTYYRLLRFLTDVSIPVDTGDFRLIDRAVNDVMKRMKERNRYIRGLVSWVGFKQYALEYERKERFAGETKYSFKKMTKLAMDGLTSFSYKPLKLGFVLMLGVLLLVLALFIVRVVDSTILDNYMDLVILFVLSLVFGNMGVIGVYLSQMNDEILERPKYIIKDKEMTGESDNNDKIY